MDLLASTFFWRSLHPFSSLHWHPWAQLEIAINNCTFSVGGPNKFCEKRKKEISSSVHLSQSQGCQKAEDKSGISTRATEQPKLSLETWQPWSFLGRISVDCFNVGLQKLKKASQPFFASTRPSSQACSDAVSKAEKAGFFTSRKAYLNTWRLGRKATPLGSIFRMAASAKAVSCWNEGQLYAAKCELPGRGRRPNTQSLTVLTAISQWRLLWPLRTWGGKRKATLVKVNKHFIAPFPTLCHSFSGLCWSPECLSGHERTSVSVHTLNGLFWPFLSRSFSGRSSDPFQISVGEGCKNAKACFPS